MRRVDLLKNSIKSSEKIQNKKNIRQKIKNNLDDKIKIKMWIRTLLSSFKIFPKIIDTIDKIVMSKASGYSFAADIFNFSNGQETPFDTIIDMSERKRKVLNIYVMTKTMLDSLSKENYELICGKFYDLLTNDELAVEYGVSTRTIFRKINDIIEKLYNFTLRNNWSLKFIELQVNQEDWLKEKYEGFIDEYIINSYK